MQRSDLRLELQILRPPSSVLLCILNVVQFHFQRPPTVTQCVMTNILNTVNMHQSPSGALVGTTATSMNPGLDPVLVQSFPTFKYSTVKDFYREKYGLECSICLVEFGDDDMLRLLTTCYHVFHQECIDLWLESHKTCPVCRKDLELSEKLLEKSPMLVHSHSMHELGESIASPQDAISIEVKEDNGDQEGRGEGGAPQASSDAREQKERREKLERFSRSHSTGHSIHNNVEEDRYTLRLLENVVQLKFIKGQHSAVSCVTFGEFSSPIASRNGGFGDGAECSRGNINRV
ncbi:hypothetical protein SLEP1_g22009 [Rubroshorea leprosula]|uniref:RING-type E3 ubiquitin transferase n=1 Tax=Rubroshorea leprosula TaxID=152421 RepID=A0AAV5JH38_9ROSI|nr:hypothetical protein SLEP1_g22009 [Rubroshorea leprosula]